MPGVPALLWADVETTGLGPDANILEIGLRVTDSDLTTLAEQSWVVPYSATEIAHHRAGAKPVVQEMHDASGLWTECAQMWDTSDHRAAAKVMRETYWHRDIAATVRAFVVANAPGRLPMAGSSVRADREWLTGWVLDFDELLHYRIVDVSSVKTLMGMWAPDRLQGAPVPARRHRVMPDLDDSIAELAFYRSVLGLVPTEMAV